MGYRWGDDEEQAIDEPLDDLVATDERPITSWIGWDIPVAKQNSLPKDLISGKFIASPKNLFFYLAQETW